MLFFVLSDSAWCCDHADNSCSCGPDYENEILKDHSDPDERVQTVTITPTELPPRTFVEVPYSSPPVIDGKGTAIIVAGIMTPEFVTHRAFDAQMIESAWLAPFFCDELDRVINAVYARHGFFFLNGETRTYFLRFDLRYRPDMNLRIPQIEAKFTSQDQLTLLRAEVALENRGCSQEENAAD
ncbi:MAG: hypothetical protein WC654_00925 [Patescibacteria group bacterium]